MILLTLTRGRAKIEESIYVHINDFPLEQGH